MGRREREHGGDSCSGHDAGMTQRAPSILERPVYGVAEAAGLLGLRSDRTRAWLDGYTSGGVTYQPVIRREPTGDDLVTWASSSNLATCASTGARACPCSVSDR